MSEAQELPEVEAAALALECAAAACLDLARIYEDGKIFAKPELIARSDFAINSAKGCATRIEKLAEQVRSNGLSALGTSHEK